MSIERWDFGTISCPVPYKFEIGRCGGRGANRNGGCEFGIEIFEIGPRGWRGKKLFGRRHHSRDSSRWKNFNWPFTVGTKIGFHRWWPGRIIPRLPWTPRNKRFNGQSFGHWTGKWLLFVTVTESIIYKRSTNRFARWPLFATPTCRSSWRDDRLSWCITVRVGIQTERNFKPRPSCPRSSATFRSDFLPPLFFVPSIRENIQEIFLNFPSSETTSPLKLLFSRAQMYCNTLLSRKIIHPSKIYCWFISFIRRCDFW